MKLMKKSECSKFSQADPKGKEGKIISWNRKKYKSTTGKVALWNPFLLRERLFGSLTSEIQIQLDYNAIH